MGLVFPNVCYICGTTLVEGEDTLCLNCMVGIPRVNIHRRKFNDIHKRLAAPGVPIQRAGSWFYYYTDNPYSQLIRDGKYNNRPWLCRWLGRNCAAELNEDGFFDGIDILLPVGMHYLKQYRRGYNQTYMIAQGIHDVTGIPVGTHLKADRTHSAQAKKSALERVSDFRGIYSAAADSEICDGRPAPPLWRLVKRLTSTLPTSKLETQHVLVIDDVITTGSTLLANCKALFEAAPDISLSVLSIGLTHIR